MVLMQVATEIGRRLDVPADLRGNPGCDSSPPKKSCYTPRCRSSSQKRMLRIEQYWNYAIDMAVELGIFGC